MTEIQNKPKKEIKQPPPFIPVKNFNYDANSLRSPFMPPTLSQRLAAEQERAENQVEPDIDRPKEALEDFDLNQLVMRGIVDDIDGKRYALIEEPTGTLMKVTVGNHMGLNFGRIIEINERDIELLEVVKDGKNGYVERPKTLLAPTDTMK